MSLAPSLRLLVLSLFVALVLVTPALAAAASGDAAHATTGHGDEKKGSLDFTGIKRWDLGIYTLVVFGLLMFVVGQFAWPNIRAGLEKREASIGGAHAEAKRDRAEAATYLVEAKKQLDAAAAQAKEILDAARRDAESLKAAEREVGVKEAEAERERARRDLAIERDAALKDVYTQAVELATIMATKAVRQQVTVDAQNALVSESIAELNASKA